MADWMSALAADGPKVAAWLEREMPWLTADASQGGDPAAARRLRDWRLGARAEFYTLDKLLIRHHRHVSDLPDDVWLEGYARQKGSGMKPTTNKRVQQIVEPKPCRHCGEEIPRVTPGGIRLNPSAYRAREFCSQPCQWQGKGASPRPRVAA